MFLRIAGVNRSRSWYSPANPLYLPWLRKPPYLRDLDSMKPFVQIIIILAMMAPAPTTVCCCALRQAGATCCAGATAEQRPTCPRCAAKVADRQSAVAKQILAVTKSPAKKCHCVKRVAEPRSDRQIEPELPVDNAIADVADSGYAARPSTGAGVRIDPRYLHPPRTSCCWLCVWRA